MNPVGKIRPGQLITTYGPGSIVDLENDSVMIMGLNRWYDHLKYTIHQPPLENLLGVRKFVSPPNGDDARGNIPCISFPTYRECEKCSKLSNNFPRIQGRFRCDEPGCTGKTHPARFIIACRNGHIDDFPWIEWAHQGQLVCSRPRLKLITKPFTSSLAGMEVRCECGAHHNMAKSMSEEALGAIGVKCNGNMPWLDTKVSCDQTPVTVQRGASNVYFPLIVSAISVPPWTSTLQDKLNSISETLPEKPSPEIIKALLAYLKTLPDLSSYSEKQLEEALMTRVNQEPYKNLNELKKQEWTNFYTLGQSYEKEFEMKEEKLPDSLQPYMDKLVLVNRIREVRCLRGFVRIDPGDPEMGEEGFSSRIAYLTTDSPKWLPAVEVRGEGIFVSLDSDLIDSWEERKAVRERMAIVNKLYSQWRAERNLPAITPISARFVLVHTLAHLLIRQLAVSSGYSSTALRERIYCDHQMAAFLIYTASDDSEGSLGGLVEQGHGFRFEQLLGEALESASICSNDPLCAEAGIGITGSINGAACHACCFVSETSCEYSNRLLDRSIVTDTTDSFRLGFFSTQKPAKDFQNLKYVTETGILVRSKSEVIVANILSNFADRGLNFDYERPLFASQSGQDFKRIRPDFTISFNGKTWYWEHLGLPGDEQYMQNWKRKEQWYKNNGYFDQLITSRDELDGSINSQEIRDMVTELILTGS